MGRYAFLFIAIVTITYSCGVDVTTDPNFNYGYQKGQIFRTKIKLYLTNRPNNTLKIPGETSPSIENYEKYPNKYRDIKGFIETNEKLEIVKLIYHKTFEDSFLEVYGKLLSGKHRGEVVSLLLISRSVFKPFPKGGSMSAPDPKILELIE